MDWLDYKNFEPYEFDCKHSGENKMRPEFMQKLQHLRDKFGKPMPINSGYRSPTHPIEARKSKPGKHAEGIAADIGVRGADAVELLKLALELGFTGIGIAQKGGSRFIHLDISTDENRPTIWSY